MSSPDDFSLNELTHVKYLFNPNERIRLLKHGAFASRYDWGGAIPSTLSQKQFIAVCRGVLEPKSDFEFLWLRYKETIRIDQQLDALHNECGETSVKIEVLRADFDRQKNELQA